MKKSKKIFFGWWIVLSASLQNGLGGSIHWQGFTVLFIPISQTFGISSAQTSLLFALARAENGLMGPFTGWLMDKFGPRPLAIGGTAMAGIGYIMLSRTGNYTQFLLIYVIVISIGATTSFMQTAFVVLNNWFIKQRGLVMSINSASFRLGSAILVPTFSYIVYAWGWQNAVLILGIFLLVFITPLGIFYRKTPESMGLQPDGEIQELNEGSLHNKEISGYTWKEAIKTSAFWFLTIATALRISIHGAIFVHMIPILVWKGISPESAAWYVGFLALTGVPVILIVGKLSDKFGRPKMLALCYSASALSLLLVNLSDNSIYLLLSLLLLVGSEAGSGLNWSLVGDLFGRKNYGVIRGLLGPFYNAALVITPVSAGYIYDKTNSYEIVLYIGSIIFILSSLVFLLVGVLAKKLQT
ncbi:MAG: MFS transporter [Dehalococcoidia bacterium]|nr:MFS transporter [Dehalococcoidia bacterium]